MLKVRAAAAGDLPVLLALMRASDEERHRSRYIEESVLSALLAGRIPGSVLLAWSEDRPVGYCCFCVYGSTALGSTRMRLDDLFVLPAERKRYFGKLMVNTAVRMASESLCTEVSWRCDTEGGRAFFARCGAPEPVGADYTVGLTQIPRLAAFEPTCGDRRMPLPGAQS